MAVTTDLSIAFCGVPDVDGTELRSASRTVSVDKRSAVADGEVVNSRGVIAAKAVERVMFTPDQPVNGVQISPDSIDRDSEDVMALLGGRCRDDAVLLDVGRLSLNPAGALHGGVAVFMSERAASWTVGARVDGLTPTALQAVHRRVDDQPPTVKVLMMRSNPLQHNTSVAIWAERRSAELGCGPMVRPLLCDL